MNQFAHGRPLGGTADMAVDQGLRAFMLGVYNKMGVGLLLSAAIAYFCGEFNGGAIAVQIFSSPLKWVVMFAPIAILFVSMFAMRNPSPTGANALFWTFVTAKGLSLSVLFLVFKVDSLITTLLATSLAFFSLSLWGYTTKKDLSGFGSFLIMGLVGLLVASLVNMFLKSDMMSFVISGIGVLLFAGLTAFDTQQLKYSYYELNGNERALSVSTTYGALNLYINFISLFQFLLSFLGVREE